MAYQPQRSHPAKRERDERDEGRPAPPQRIENDEVVAFEGSIPIDDIQGAIGISLNPSLLKQLKEGMKFTSLFPIQVKTLEAILSGKDVLARARTGSGKTLAFALPVVQQLLANPRADRRNPHAFVLSPTRELALQSHKVFEGIIPPGAPIKSIAVYGGISISIQKTEIYNARGFDIVVGTPGRFIDFMNNGTIRLDSIRVAILDEADRMLDEGFAEDVEKVLVGIPEKNYQLLLFSATVPSWVENVVTKFGKVASSRVSIDLVGHNTVSVSETVTFYELLVYSAEERLLVMGDLIRVFAGRNGRVIIFTKTKAECHELGVSTALKSDTQTLHGDMKQEEREKTMQAFREGKFNTLIATDVAARGLDIPRVDLVIQTSVPQDFDSFIHRAGRTGRAGRRGVCIVLRSRYDNLYRLAERCRITFQPLAAPSKEEVMTAISRDIADSIEMVDDTVTNWFRKAATGLLEGKSHEESIEVVSKALALLAGYTKKEKSRSLIGSRLGAVTVSYRITDPKSYYYRNLRVPAILSHVEEQLGPGMGRTCQQITICGNSGTGMYAVFDMDEAQAVALTEKFKGVPNMQVEIIHELPSDYVARPQYNR
eukprot:PhF_6_TR6140/c0_g1_i1/m.9114/K16911/DDX21; ATP-dependent RNA helicase DDX21